MSVPDIETVQHLVFPTLLVSRMGDMGADMVSYSVQFDQTGLDPHESRWRYQIDRTSLRWQDTAQAVEMTMRCLTLNQIRIPPDRMSLCCNQGLMLLLVQALKIILRTQHLLNVDAPVEPRLTRFNVLHHGSDRIDTFHALYVAPVEEPTCAQQQA